MHVLLYEAPDDMSSNPDTLLLGWPLDLSLSYVLTHTQEVCLMLSDEVPVNLLDLLSAGLWPAHWLACQLAFQLAWAVPIRLPAYLSTS